MSINKEQFIKELEKMGIIEAIGDAISIQDTNYKILYQNQVNKDFMGVQVGEYCYEAYEHRALICEGCALTTAFKDGKTHTTVRSISTDKGIEYFEITGSPLRDFTGEIIGGIEVARNITERKRIEEVLKHSEKKYRNLVDNSLVGIYKTHLKGNIYYANDALAKIFEFKSPEEMISVGVYKLYKNPKDWEVLLENLKKTGRVNNFEIEALTKTGKTKHILLSATLEGDILSGMIIDITERKNIEKKIILVNERLKFLMFSTSAVIYTAKTSGDYGATFITDNVVKLVGHENRKFLENPSFWINNVHPEDKQRILAELPIILEKGYHSYEYRFRNKEGKYIWVSDEMQLMRDKKGKPLEIIGFWLDITKRKKAEDALQKAHDNLEIRIKERTSELAKTEETLKIHVTELKETDTAVRVLMKQQAKDKQEFEKTILSNIKHLILPYIEKLRKKRSMSKELSYLNILESNLNDIVSSFSTELSSKYLSFTSKEIQIADLIKDGSQDKDIAGILNISLETVKSHRQNIRKKLGIYSKRAHLRTHLLSRFK